MRLASKIVNVTVSFIVIVLVVYTLRSPDSVAMIDAMYPEGRMLSVSDSYKIILTIMITVVDLFKHNQVVELAKQKCVM